MKHHDPITAPPDRHITITKCINYSPLKYTNYKWGDSIDNCYRERSVTHQNNS